MSVLRQIQETSAIPAYGKALPSPIKALALVSVLHPMHLSSTEECSLAQILLPLGITALILASVYAYPILLARRQHRLLTRHIISVSVIFFVYVNGTVLLSTYWHNSANFLSIMCSLHILHCLREFLRPDGNHIYKTHNILAGQNVIAAVLGIGEVTVLAATWLVTTHPEANYQQLLYCAFLPELSGMLVQASFDYF